MDVLGEEYAEAAGARFDEALVLHLLVEDQVAVVEALRHLITACVRREAKALSARGEELDIGVLFMGFGTLLIAHIAFNVPYVIFNVTPKLKQLDIKLFEAALDLGCDPRQAFFKVILPEISPAILSGFLISLTYSIDDFMISYFNCGTVETLPIAIYSMTRKKVSPEIYALSTIMFVVILSIILISNAMESRGYRRDQRALRGGDVK